MNFISLPRLFHTSSFSSQRDSMALKAYFCIVFLCKIFGILAENKQVDIDEQFRGLKAEVIVSPPENCDRYSKKGDLLTLHYNGWRAEDMELLETSHVGKDLPEQFQLGTLEKIRAWDLGLENMCVGEKRRLIVPQEYAYDIYGSKDKRVPPDTNLIYEIELLGIKDGPAQGPIEAFTAIDKDGDGYLTMEEVTTFLQEKSEEQPDDPEAVMLLGNATFFQNYVNVIFAAEDIDNDGRISASEFSEGRAEKDDSEREKKMKEYEAMEAKEEL